MRRLTRRAGPLALALCLALALEGCSGSPPWFEVVALDAAQQMLSDPEIAVVEAIDATGDDAPPVLGGFRWELPVGAVTPPEDLPAEGPVLVVGVNEATAYRSAAALARAGNRPVYVFIPVNADERSRLRASALPEEIPRGHDS